jgi:ribose 5-phosphate isomerase B
MKIGLSSDHRGLHLLQVIASELEDMGHEVVMFAPEEGQACDYPDQAGLVCDLLKTDKIERGVLVCGTGIGMCITANKYPGVRAALASDELSGQLSRSHNDANVLCLSGDLIGHALGRRIISIWMDTEFEGGRHERRINKISLLDQDPELTEN